MKNIFKLLAIAFVAGGMMTFTACGDDDPDTPDTPDTPTTPSVKVVFDNVDQGTMGSITATNYVNYGITVLDAFAAQQTYPGVEIYTKMTAPGNNTATFNGQGLEGDPAICEFYKERALQDQQGTTYGDWWAESASINVSKYDATNSVISFTVQATMFDAFYALVPYNENGDTHGYNNETPRAEMNVTVSNINFTTNNAQ